MKTNHENTGIASVSKEAKLRLACIFAIFIATSGLCSAFPLEEWIAKQLKTKNVEFINLIDHKLWLQAPEHHTYIVLGIGQGISQFKTDSKEFTFPYVLLMQSKDLGNLKNAKLLAMCLPEKGLEGELSSMIAIPGDLSDGPVSIDLGPYPLRKEDYGFGIRYRVGKPGNKGGTAYEVLGLFRYHNSELKEILRDVVWAYSKFESGDKSCNSEMALVPEKSECGGIFNYIRKHRRSYYGESKGNPEWAAFAGVIDTPVKSCESFRKLESVNIHRWNAQKGIYLDSSGVRNGRLLWWDSLFK